MARRYRIVGPMPTLPHPVPTYIPGLNSFDDALDRLADGSHGIRPADIERVEATWGFADGHHSSAGFVLSLDGGRRVYLSYVCEEEEPGMPVRMAVETLIVGQDYPAFDTPYEPLGGWSHETAPFDALLASARR